MSMTPRRRAVRPRGDRPPARRLAARSRPRSRPGRRAAAPGRVRRGDRLRDLVVHGRRRTPGCARPQGTGPTDAFAASELPAGRRYDRVVAISRSGTTTEVRPGGRRRRARPCWRSPPSPAPRWPPRRPTRSCSTSPTSSRSCRPCSPRPTLMLLRASLGESVDAGHRPGARGARRAAPRRRRRSATVEQISFLGRHWAFGVAQEAALKCARRAGSGPSPTRRWSTGTGRSPSPSPAAPCG